MSTYFSGLGVAIVTPFDNESKIDYPALGSTINHLIDNGVSYIVSLGTTGESVTLSKPEKTQLVKVTREYINHRIPLVVGAGGNNTAAVIDSINEFNNMPGIDAYLSVSPAYNKPSQAGIYAHFNAVANSTDRDVLLYNVPGRTAKNMEVDTILRLANDIDNIVGVKEAGGNMMQSMQLAKKKPSNFWLISGDDDLALAQLACGFDGVISVIGNAFPKLFADMIHFATQEDFRKARAIHYALLELIELIFEENNPAGIKCVMESLGLIQNSTRLPVVPVSPNLYNRIRKWVDNFAYPNL